MIKKNRLTTSKFFFLSIPAIVFALLLQPPMPAFGAEMDRAGFTSATVCAYCHEDIYESWNRSAHSWSYADSTFMDAYRHAYTDTKGAAKDLCFTCHAPTTIVTKDFDGAMPITKEGVTCDFCHSVEDVNLSHMAAPYKIDVGGEKRASMALDKNRKFEKTDAAHQAAYAKWFNKSEMCAGCHEITNMKGVVVGGTYSEWKSSAYSKGDYAKKSVQCQDCHMARIKGNPVNASVKKTGKDTVPDHSLSHNLARLVGSVSLEIVKADRADGGRYVVEMAVTNVKAGHSIPTGLPSSSLTLEVEAQPAGAGAVIMRKTLGKTVVDAKGAALFSDVDAYIHGAKIAENTSLAPMEKRVVRFDLGSLPQGKVSVTGRAFLSNSTHNSHIPLASVEKK